MKNYIVINNNYTNERIPVTLDDLRDLCEVKNITATLRETQRNGVDVIVDDGDHVVAVDPAHEDDEW
jgi:hypothetical protein